MNLFYWFMATCFMSCSALANCPDSSQFKISHPTSSGESVKAPVGWSVFVGVTGDGKASSGVGKLESVRIAGKFYPPGCENNEKGNACTKITGTTDVYCNYDYPPPEDKIELHSASQPLTSTFEKADKWICVESTFPKPLCVCNITSSNNCSFTSTP